MNHFFKRLATLLGLKSYAFFYLLIISGLSHAQITFTDIAGRTITLEKPAQKIILGEGRFLAVLGVLGVEQPISKVAGMMNDFKTYDFAGYARYQEVFPEIDKVSTFGQTDEASVSIEKMIELQPEVAIFGLSGHGPGAKSKKIIDVLTAVGIKVVFIDFRQKPIENTVKSVEIVGKVLGYEGQAALFAMYYRDKLEFIKKHVALIPKEQKPRVFFDLWASNKKACCFTIAESMFAEMAEFSGGVSIAKGQLPGPVGMINNEYVLVSDFDVYIGTSSGAMNSSQEVYNHLVLGAQVSNSVAQEALQQVLQHRNFSQLRAVKSGNSFAIWHHFYNSPLNIYAIESMAKWFHPEIFKDLNPDYTLSELLGGFSPVDLSGVYSVQYSPRQ